MQDDAEIDDLQQHLHREHSSEHVVKLLEDQVPRRLLLHSHIYTGYSGKLDGELCALIVLLI